MHRNGTYGMWTAERTPMMRSHDLASTPAPRTMGLSRKRRGDAYLRRTARVRAGALCVLLGASLLAAGNPERFWGIVGTLIPETRPDTVALSAPVQLRIADSEYAKGHFKEAARRYTLLITQHPAHPLAEHASLVRIQTHVQSNDLGAAQAALESFRVQSPRHPSLPQLLLDVAALHFRVAEYDRAARNYTDAIALVTRFERAQGRLEDSEPPTPARRRAIHNEKLRRVAETTDIERTARFNLAVCYDMLARDENALSAYKRFVHRFPRDARSAEAYYRAGILERRARRLDAALASFTMVWQLPEAPAAFRAASIYQAGRCLERQRRNAAARDVYGLALALEETSDEHRLAALSRLAFLLRNDEPLRALEIYRDLADHSDGSVYRALARQHLLELQDASAMASAR